jgi:hypothetical protein
LRVLPVAETRLGAALLKGLLTWSFPDFRLTGDVVFYRRVQGKETADGVADRGTQAQGSGCPG